MVLDNFLTCFEFSFTSFTIKQNKTKPNQTPIFIWPLAVWF